MTPIYSTFLPSLTFGGSVLGITYFSRSGRAIQIDKLVWFSLTFDLNHTTTTLGNAAVVLTGLPGADITDPVNSVVSIAGDGIAGTFNGSLQGYISGDPPTVQMLYLNAGLEVPLSETSIPNFARFKISGTYQAAVSP